MDLMLLRVFQRQVLDQCHFFLLAAGDLNEGLRIANAADPTDSATKNQGDNRMWFGLQNALIAAGNLKKLLWGRTGSSAAKRTELRASVAVTGASPLRTTSVRNHWEHVDERLDKWDRESAAHNYVDKTIGPPSLIVGVDPIDRFRWFDPATSKVIFWGEEFDLQAIADEVQRIRPIAEQESEKPHYER